MSVGDVYRLSVVLYILQDHLDSRTLDYRLKEADVCALLAPHDGQAHHGFHCGVTPWSLAHPS